MRRLSYFLMFVIINSFVTAQSPHGESFELDCVGCHSPESWELLKDDMVFDHDKTNFKLEGQHKDISCTDCHSSLKFNTAKTECMECHTDMHNNTLGKDCDRCHSPKSWIVSNVTEIHLMSRFPLLGTHKTASCFDCHASADNLEFEPLGIECVDCHMKDYLATTSPNHQQAGYSTFCTDCHSARSMLWNATDIEHNFFPLKDAHNINCAECHISGTFNQLSPECLSCHQPNYNEAQNPNHIQLNFSTMCDECHSLMPGWKPAKFTQHDNEFFPIYSGEHNNTWESCTECHTNPSNYSIFTCISCHEHNQSEMDGEHSGISGYSYNSTFCFACHPRGDESGAFNHSTTAFPLTGAHVTTECSSCHTDGFAGTPQECSSCHLADYNRTTDPNHVQVSFPTQCESCHSTNAWEPATFNHDGQYFPIYSGGHRNEWNDCSDCHTQTSNYGIFSCIDCHEHSRSETDNDHDEVNGYVYNSSSCYTCHPRGDED